VGSVILSVIFDRPVKQPVSRTCEAEVSLAKP
jgi:hypothetical protein